jgi:chromosome segregation ATPase
MHRLSLGESSERVPNDSLSEECHIAAAGAAFPAVGEVSALQERLTAHDDQVASLQKELSLLQLHVREAQRAQGAAAEAQAAASKAIDQQECELAALRQQLKDAQVGQSVFLRFEQATRIRQQYASGV